MPNAGDEGSWILFPLIFPILFPIAFPMLTMMFWMMASRSGPFGMMSSGGPSAPGPREEAQRGGPAPGPGGFGPFGMMSSRGRGNRGEEPRQRDAGGGAESPLETAQRRYAAGEISREEFQRIRDDLSP